MAPNVAGLSMSQSNGGNHPSGPAKHGPKTQAERAFQVASTFLSGSFAISASQFLGAPLKLVDPGFYKSYMNQTKESFAILVTTMTQWWSPTIVRVSGDSSMRGQLYRLKDGTLKCNFANHLVLMANHQLYTDWLYLWWIAYTNNMHGRIFIILKESIKKIPIFGWAAQFYNFIFLSRNWETDRPQMERQLRNLNKPSDPMWLVIFPEGTNLSKTTREASKRWADKNGLEDMKHQLLPRSTGLQFCLQELRTTTSWLYDCTIGYEGIPKGEYGQDIYTLRSSFFEGRPPKSVNMHWRRFYIPDIPIDDKRKFEVWLRNRWREKDYLLEHFYRTGRFPADEKWILKEGSVNSSNSGASRIAPFIETEIKTKNLNEFVSIFEPITALMMGLYLLEGGASKLPITNKDGSAPKSGQPLSIMDILTPKKDMTPEEARKLITNGPAAPQAPKIEKAPKNVPKTTEKKDFASSAARNGPSGPSSTSQMKLDHALAVARGKPVGSIGSSPAQTRRRTSISTLSSGPSYSTFTMGGTRTPSVRSPTVTSATSASKVAPSTRGPSVKSAAMSTGASKTPVAQPGQAPQTQGPSEVPTVTLDPEVLKRLQAEQMARKSAVQKAPTTGPPKLSSPPSRPQATKPPKLQTRSSKLNVPASQQSKAGPGKSLAAIAGAAKPITVDPTMLAKLQSAQQNQAAFQSTKERVQVQSKTGPQTITVDPAILEKMKVAQNTIGT
ncbi:acyltransferase-domain-containing protein [Viridothelium virens]|uniref:Acyltransferase-domain-containing protein n=1 Tax=Viridothelium virens TaxID=1048519 RepID=A0A6A6GZF4_VIRVR|nr:acyltransferase-domain-containing protein [Viridothelium virens]